MIYDYTMTMYVCMYGWMDGCTAHFFTILSCSACMYVCMYVCTIHFHLARVCMHDVLHNTVGHVDMASSATVISHTLYTMLHITAGPGGLISGAMVISHTLYTMLHIPAGHVDMVSVAVYVPSIFILLVYVCIYVSHLGQQLSPYPGHNGTTQSLCNKLGCVERISSVRISGGSFICSAYLVSQRWCLQTCFCMLVVLVAVYKLPLCGGVYRLRASLR